MAKRNDAPVIEGKLVPIDECFSNTVLENLSLDSDENVIRAIVDASGRLWFVAKDICSAFGDTHYRRSVGRLDNDEKAVTLVQTVGGKQSMTVVTESGLYSMLFRMEPKKSPLVSAESERVNRRIDMLEAFKIWVFGEVLPSIRKNGYYLTPAMKNKVFQDPDIIIELALKLKAERENNAMPVEAIL